MTTTSHLRLGILALAFALAGVHAGYIHAKTPRATTEPEPLVLFDFEDQESALDWRVVSGTLDSACAELPVALAAGPEGHGLRTRNEESATLMTRHGVLQTDWSAYEALSFWEWFQEGLASRYQWRFHPEAMTAGFIRRHMAAPDGHQTLPRPCHGKRIDLEDYWQAMTVVDLLFEHPRYAPHFEALLQGFRDAGATDLRPHVGTVLGVSWDELERDWQEDVERRYGSDGG